MTETAKVLRRKYYKEWNKKNPEKRKKYIERYWEKKAKEQGEN